MVEGDAAEAKQRARYAAAFSVMRGTTSVNVAPRPSPSL
jgi:hypothetical protein